MPIVERCTNDLNNFVKEVVERGFYPQKGYMVDINFILTHGSRELAEEAIKRYYDSLEESIKKNLKITMKVWCVVIKQLVHMVII